MSERFFKCLERMVAAVAIAGVLAAGQGCKRATEPATPKAVTLAFSRALSAGDVALARSLSTGDVGPQTLETLAKLASSTQRLQQALKSKFGEKALQLPIFTESPDPQDELNRSTETITGDTAVISLSATDQNPTKLKKIDGQWKMDITKFKDAESMLPQMRKIAVAWDDLAADVTAGKFAAIDDFKKAFDAKAMAATSGG